MLNRFFHFEKKITPQSYNFEINEIWREAFQLAKKHWLKLVVADAIFIAVFTSFIWMAWLGRMFPWLNSFRPNPDISQWPTAMQAFFMLSKEAWPILFTLFVSFPVYLSLLYMSTCVVYQRPIHLRMLTHFLNLRWWVILLTLTIFIGLFLLPMAVFFFFFYQKAKATGTMAQFSTLLSAIGIAYLLLSIMYSMTLNLIFIAKQNIVDAFRASWLAVKQHPFKVAGILLIWYVCQRLGTYTYYLSDIILFPPSYIAWALLYKRMFGDAGFPHE